MSDTYSLKCRSITILSMRKVITNNNKSSASSVTSKTLNLT